VRRFSRISGGAMILGCLGCFALGVVTLVLIVVRA
jgi:hypothetical protein